MTSAETRKAERITGLEVRWLPQPRQMAGFSDGVCLVVVTGATAKMALIAFLRENLDRIRQQRLRETKGACERCGSHRPLHLHHRKHRSQGRDDRPENLLLCCESCHRELHGV